MWNAFEDIQNGLKTTNNSVEGWHRGFAVFIGTYHPDLFAFMYKLRSHQRYNELLVENYIAGKRLPAARRFDVKRHESILGSVRRYVHLVGATYTL